MIRRTARTAVAVRGVSAAVIATAAATVGHAVAQHALPSPWVVAVAVALAAPLCVALAGARLSVARLAVAVALSQLAFHVLLGLDFTASTPLTTGMHHGTATVTAMTMTDAAGPALHGTTPAMAPAMILGHLVAAVVTVVALATAERSIAALAALARRPFRVLAALVAPRPARALSVAATPLVVARRLLLSPLRPRGPPLPA